jgi:RNA polymerase sigma factor (sigma-70 family)
MTRRIPPEVAAQVARLFVEEAEAVFRSALRAARGDGPEAEDLVQMAFQAAAEEWTTIVDYPLARKRAWLCRVAINKAIDGYRSGKRVQPAADPVDAASVSPSAEHVALTWMQAERCLKVINEMPEMRSKVAYLKFHEGWDTREIAGHLGISPSTVRVHLRDARVVLEAVAGSEVSFTEEPDNADNHGREEAR